MNQINKRLITEARQHDHPFPACELFILSNEKFPCLSSAFHHQAQASLIKKYLNIEEISQVYANVTEKYQNFPEVIEVAVEISSLKILC